MSRVIAISNLKGGIGKTTTVVNLGAGLALKGARVLLVDVDAQGNLSMALGVRPRRTLYEVLVDGAAAADCVFAARPTMRRWSSGSAAPLASSRWCARRPPRRPSAQRPLRCLPPPSRRLARWLWRSRPAMARPPAARTAATRSSTPRWPATG
jgi:chromosome partitioning protein